MRSYSVNDKCIVAPHSVITVSLLLDCTEDGSSNLHRNVGAYVPIYMISFFEQIICQLHFTASQIVKIILPLL